MSSQQRLLGRLAELSWFSKNGEVASTRSVAMLLEDESLRLAVSYWLSNASGVDLSGVKRWLAEQVHADRGRPDIEGLDAFDRPVVVMEAKFGAELTDAQLASYLADQQARLSGSDDEAVAGLFVVLVPATRLDEAGLKLARANRAQLASAPVQALVATWDDMLGVLEDAAAELGPAGVGVQSDVEQLRAMCTALGGTVIAPLGSAVLGSRWMEREQEFRAVLDQVTRGVSGANGRLAPIGDEPGFLARRYFPSGYRTAEGECGAAAVGIRPDQPGSDDSPIWLRIHRRTPGFAAIRHRLAASVGLKNVSGDGGHLWLPLEVDPELPGIDLVNSLIRQIELIKNALR